jgi:hypothetical protein
MGPYSGFEPQVGEIRALRTFRVGPGGVLYPLFSNVPWADGTNTARCKLTTPDGDGEPHTAPEPDCTCGYYAYASEAAAGEYPNARHVLAVVACWGHIIAGTRGIRAQHARIEALWIADTVPSDLTALVAGRYSGAAMYDDRAEMLARYSPTMLDCYEVTAVPEQAGRQILTRVAVFVGLAFGLLPGAWLRGNSDARIVWGIELGFVVVTAVLLHRRTDVAARRQELLFLALALWLMAPFAGAGGTVLLRLPLIQIAVLGLVHRRLLERAAGRFPAVIDDD